MQRIKRQRLGVEAWRAILARFSESGLTAAAFCRREAIGAASFYQWRTRLGAPSSAMPARSEPATTAGFVDIGALRTTDAATAAFELHLDLGGGLTLQLRRG
jgi:transposase-like protein